MRKWLIPLVLLANPALAQEHQQTHQTDGDPCLVEGACRTVEQLQIVGPDGEAHIVDLGITIPWLRQGNIMLTPGESVTVSLQE